jgi:hypothetical protein
VYLDAAAQPQHFVGPVAVANIPGAADVSLHTCTPPPARNRPHLMLLLLLLFLPLLLLCAQARAVAWSPLRRCLQASCCWWCRPWPCWREVLERFRVGFLFDKHLGTGWTCSNVPSRDAVVLAQLASNDSTPAVCSVVHVSVPTHKPTRSCSNNLCLHLQQSTMPSRLFPSLTADPVAIIDCRS